MNNVNSLVAPVDDNEDKARILVVEDNDFYRNFILRHLKLEGYRQVIQAADGEQAMDLVKLHQFDAILLDIMMPGTNGYEVLRLLKADDQLRHIPVIMISTVDEMDSIIKCIELGAEDYLPKPVNPTLLRARLNTSLERKFLRDREQVYINQIEMEKKRVNDLLNIALPKAAAIELKEKGYVSPRRFENVTVLFCDVIQFTEHCDRYSPEEVANHVSELIEIFENITLKYDMEKIKTIGDEFMATAGLLEQNDEPVLSAINCGLEMTRTAPTLSAGWQVRVGIDHGDVVGGIVGKLKYQFDVWGDTVNTAARMTRYGEPGKVVMTKETSDIVANRFRVQPLGTHNVKGKGMIDIVACSQE